MFSHLIDTCSKDTDLFQMGSDDEMPGSGDEREEVSFSPQIQSTFFTHTLFPPFDDMRYPQ